MLTFCYSFSVIGGSAGWMGAWPMAMQVLSQFRCGLCWGLDHYGRGKNASERASSEIANERKTAGRETKKAYSIFLKTLIRPRPTFWKNVVLVKMLNKRTSKGCRRVSSHAWQLTNHRAYLKLVYLPSPQAVFAQLFSIRFSSYLGVLNSLV